jgi:acyl carrier protein
MRHVRIRRPRSRGSQAPGILLLQHGHRDDLVYFARLGLACAGWAPAPVVGRARSHEFGQAAVIGGRRTTLLDAVAQLRAGRSPVALFTERDEWQPWLELGRLTNTKVFDMRVRLRPAYPGLNRMFCSARFIIDLCPVISQGRPAAPHEPIVLTAPQPSPSERPALVFEDFVHTLADRVGTAFEGATPELRLTEDLGIDSIDLVEVGLQLENLTGTTPSPDHLEGCMTVADLYDAYLYLMAIVPGYPNASE